MATTYTFVVILPNARRANVKAGMNTTILEVLEDVCKKYDFNSGEFDLTFHNKIVDLGNSVRFSGIPNNATLEMVPSTKTRTESVINLGLQLESGKRLMHQFLPQQTLWEVLDYWVQKGEQIQPPQNDSDVKPVCIYMRQEVVGQDALEQKTLRSLGLTKGSAMIRLIYRSESQLRTQANVSAPLSRPIIAAVDSQKKSEDKSNHHPTTTTIPPHAARQETPSSSSNGQNYIPIQHSTNAEPMEIEPATKHVEAEDTAIVHSFIPPAIQNAARFSKKGELHVVGPHDAILYHGDDVLIDSKTDSSVPDSFFDLSLNEVKKMYMELQNKRKEMEDSPLLTRSARELEKDTNTLRMLHDYPVTIVRIRFTDRYILQGCFRTGDKLETVHSWVASLLSKKDLNFCLFTAPPKKVLIRDATLVEQDLVGMTVLYFGMDELSASSSPPPDQKLLRSELYDKVSAPDAVYDFVHKKLKKTPTVGDSSSSSSSSSSSNPTSTTTEEQQRPLPHPQTQPPPRPLTEGGAVPKWFKPK